MPLLLDRGTPKAPPRLRCPRLAIDCPSRSIKGSTPAPLRSRGWHRRDSRTAGPPRLATFGGGAGRLAGKYPGKIRKTFLAKKIWLRNRIYVTERPYSFGRRRAQAVIRPVSRVTNNITSLTSKRGDYSRVQSAHSKNIANISPWKDAGIRSSRRGYPTAAEKNTGDIGLSLSF